MRDPYKISSIKERLRSLQFTFLKKRQRCERTGCNKAPREQQEEAALYKVPLSICPLHGMWKGLAQPQPINILIHQRDRSSPVPPHALIGSREGSSLLSHETRLIDAAVPKRRGTGA